MTLFFLTTFKANHLMLEVLHLVANNFNPLSLLKKST